MRCPAGDYDRYPIAMRKRPQLLERFLALQRRRLEPGEPAQKSVAVGIDAQMPVYRQTGRNPPDAARERVAGVGDGRAAEVERVALVVQDDFDHVRIHKL